MIDVIVFGAGGLGRAILDILQQGGRYRPVAFLDSEPALRGTVVDDLPVRGGIDQVDDLLRSGVAHAVVGIGDNRARVAVAEDLHQRGMHLVSAVHPLISVSPTAWLDEHLIVGPRVTICVHARIGPHSVLSSGTIVEHDNVIGRGVFLAPAVRLAGTVCIDDLATVGIGACVIPGRRVGRGAVVEPGAVVIQDVAPGSTVGGVPARVQAAPPSRFIAAHDAVLANQPV